MRVAATVLEERFSTLVDLLRWRAEQEPHRQAIEFLPDDDLPALGLTYAQLDRRARALAALLRQRGLDGERALLVYPSGLDFIVAFYGCLYAGTVAVPAYPPRPQTLHRLDAVAADAQPAIALTTSTLAATLEPAAHLAAALRQLEWMSTDTVADSLADDWSGPAERAGSPAFLQYTSGSTASPKGVAVSHGNIMRNSGAIAHCFGNSERSRGLFWLPPQHDMGLIGGIIQPIFAGAHVTLMSPASFLHRPMRWLEHISRARATTSGAPNFAYDLCARKARPDHLSTLDLSCWELALTGAEPVRAETLERFAATFAAVGFRPSAFTACYGLAEATLLVTSGARDEPPRTATVLAAALEGGHAIPTDPYSDSGIGSRTGSDTGRTLVSCGRSWPGQQVIVVDPDTALPRDSYQVGEVWVRGPSVALGYWRRPAESDRVFRAQLADGTPGAWLRTGDLGYLNDGELFLVGRLKDLIVIDGRNHFPEDIEQIVESSHEHVSPNGSAAFAVDRPTGEQLVVVVEVDPAARYRSGFDADAMIRTIRGAVATGHDVHVSSVVLVRRGGIPRTTSGKIRRGSCRQDFEAGTLKTLAVVEAAETARVTDIGA